MARIFLALGAVNAFLCVVLGAFGAHGLKQKLTPDMLAVYQTGVQYHFYHALGLLAVGLMLMHFPASKPIKWSDRGARAPPRGSPRARGRSRRR